MINTLVPDRHKKSLSLDSRRCKVLQRKAREKFYFIDKEIVKFQRGTLTIRKYVVTVLHRNPPILTISLLHNAGINE